ncbi:MAG: chemotaxis protein CheB [Capsulimonadales bacterium]|nr:chemotaxis protein CheB [Capsulimonadales bacterium]
MSEPVSNRGMRGVIVIGTSAGGPEALRQLVRGLPSGLEAAVLIVQHIAPNAESLLPELLSRAGSLPAGHAHEGERPLPGHIYIAPPDRHLILARGRMHLSAGPRENFARPAIDVLFRSAAWAYGSAVIGIVLTGMLSDGTAGLWEVKQYGGVAVVQTLRDAAFPSMPYNAMNQVPVDYVLPVAEMPALLAKLLRNGGRRMVEARDSDAGKPGEASVERDSAEQVAGERDGKLTVFTCPECGGSLWQANAGPTLRFRCHVGHVYYADHLLNGLTENLERALWFGIRTLRDRAHLAGQVAGECRRSGDEAGAARYEESARTDDEHAERLREMLTAATTTNHAG